MGDVAVECLEMTKQHVTKCDLQTALAPIRTDLVVLNGSAASCWRVSLLWRSKRFSNPCSPLLKIFQYFLSGRTVPWYGADWTLCVQAQNHGAVSGRENAAVAAFSRPACAAPLSEWRGALHCMQIV